MTDGPREDLNASPDDDDPVAAALGRFREARRLLAEARTLIDTGAADLAALPARGRDELVPECRAAIAAHAAAKTTTSAAQDAMYAAVRRLKRQTTRGDVAELLGLTDALVRWIVEDRPTRRRSRRQARTSGDG
ncbi:hypothetical protein JOL79_06735 [Microbispora sp. RL4-1S]|uniref:Uncharacterized protein n=1 Tax=Microbispora oryzae TaxID=2806554 RepID=A0A940WF36_9ACTN|nr:hypothetical protein [Microbispora oryzae]MBP2703493.1 hypothetical protein [Microbispora oryzae]